MSTLDILEARFGAWITRADSGTRPVWRVPCPVFRVPCGVARVPYHARRVDAWRRWWAFNFVGGLGILVQLLVLTGLTRGAGVNYLVATAAAVEAAVVHNFLWHEHWTWCDRAVQDRNGWWQMLLRFQFANGALSLGGNLFLMWLFAGVGSAPYPLANAASIALCSILNFLAGDRWVFKNTGHGVRDTGCGVRT